MKFGIDKFIGIWKSEDGYRLEISKIADDLASASLYDPSDEPVIRPYYENKPALQMPASYDEYHGEFVIELWKHGKGFNLDLTYLDDFVLKKQKIEELVPAISRYEKDHFLDKYYKIFGNLKNFQKNTQ